MSLKAKIEAVIYAAEEPVTLQQLVSLLGQEAQAELDAAAALQGQLALMEADPILLVEGEPGDEDVAGEQEALNAGAFGSEASPVPEQRIDSAQTDDFPVAEGATGTTETELPEPDAGGFPPTPGPAGVGTGEENASGVETDRQSDVPTQADEPTAAASRARERRLREYMRSVLDALIAEYASGDRGLEIREIAGGFRFATKPEYHDAVRGFVRSLKPPLKLSLQALETLAVVAYKQPVTAPEVSEVRGVDSGGVLGSLMARKLVTTAGRKQVIGRPILYKTTKEFLVRFGLKDLAELPSIEEFERMAGALNEAVQEEIPMADTPTVPVGTVVDKKPLSPAEVASEVEPSRHEHSAQADGDPNASIPSPDEVDDEHLTPAPDGPGEFTGDQTAPPVDNVELDGRISGVPPSYDQPGDEAMDSPAHDAEVQAGQMENAGEDD